MRAVYTKETKKTKNLVLRPPLPARAYNLLTFW
jgi:hypothetical protein